MKLAGREKKRLEKAQALVKKHKRAQPLLDLVNEAHRRFFAAGRIFRSVDRKVELAAATNLMKLCDSFIEMYGEMEAEEATASLSA